MIEAIGRLRQGILDDPLDLWCASTHPPSSSPWWLAGAAPPPQASDAWGKIRSG